MSLPVKSISYIYSAVQSASARSFSITHLIASDLTLNVHDVHENPPRDDMHMHMGLFLIIARTFRLGRTTHDDRRWRLVISMFHVGNFSKNPAVVSGQCQLVTAGFLEKCTPWNTLN